MLCLFCCASSGVSFSVSSIFFMPSFFMFLLQTGNQPSCWAWHPLSHSRNRPLEMRHVRLPLHELSAFSFDALKLKPCCSMESCSSEPDPDSFLGGYAVSSLLHQIRLTSFSYPSAKQELCLLSSGYGIFGIAARHAPV